MRGPNKDRPEWIREWYKHGQLEWDIPLVELDGRFVRHGTSTQYYEDGAVKLTRQYKQGREHGLEQLFDRQGARLHELEFHDGKLIRTTRP